MTINSANMNITGIQCLNAGVMTGRSIAGTTNQFTVANGDGVAGDPTITIANPCTIPGIFGTASGATGSIANAGTFTLITGLAAGQFFTVCAYATGTATPIRAFAYVCKSSAAATSDQLVTNGCTITISGTTVILTNTSGNSHTFNYGYSQS